MMVLQHFINANFLISMDGSGISVYIGPENIGETRGPWTAFRSPVRPVRAPGSNAPGTSRVLRILIMKSGVNLIEFSSTAIWFENKCLFSSFIQLPLITLLYLTSVTSITLYTEKLKI